MPGKERKISFKRDLLKKAMKERGFSRSALCNAAGISPDTFSGYLRTERIMPAVLERICAVLDCDEDYIAGFNEEDLNYSHDFKKVDMFKSIAVNAQIPKPEFYATLFEMYGFPPEVIKSIKKDPFTGSGRGFYVITMLDDFMERIKKEELRRFYQIMSDKEKK